MTTRYDFLYAAVSMDRLAQIAGNLAHLNQYEDIHIKEFKKNTDLEALASADRFIKRLKKSYGENFEVIPITLAQWKRIVKEYEIEYSDRARELLECNFTLGAERRLN